MRLLYFCALALVSSLTSFAFAQETPTKISAFGYGTTGQDVILDVDVVDGKLYGIFSTLFGETNAGLISEINPATGVATPVLDPEKTSWRGGAAAAVTPNVFQAGGQQFAIVTDLASGQTLYTINDEEPTVLLSGPNRKFSNFVSFKDSLFFLSANIPISQSPNAGDQLIAELWRTDGTPGGTHRVATLFSFFSPEEASLVAGDSSLLIRLEYLAESAFYIYDGTDSEIGILGEGFSQFTLNRFTPATDQSTYAAFHDGGFYLTGIENGASFSQIFRVDEATYAIERIPPPQPLLIFAIEDPVDRLSFIKLENELLFAGTVGAFSPLNGPWLYRIGGENGTTTTLLYEPDEFNNVPSESTFPAVVAQDTVYQLTRNVDNTVTLLRYATGMTATAALVNIGVINEEDGDFPVFMEINETHVYVIDGNDQRILRIAKADPEAFSSTTFGATANSGSVRDPQLELLGTTAYFINNSPDSLAGTGLYRWEATEEAPSKLGDYATAGSLRLPNVLAYDTLGKRLFLATDSLFLFDAVDQTTQGLTAQEGFTPFFVSALSNRLLFRSSSVNGFAERPFLLEQNGEIILPPLVTDLPITDDTSYAVGAISLPNPDTVIARILIDVDGENLYFPAVAYLSGDSLHLQRIPDFSINNRSFIQTIGGGRTCFRVPSLMADSSYFYTVDGNGNYLGAVSFPSSAPVARATTPTGVYFEIIDEFFQNRFQFIPYDQPEAVQAIALDRAVPAANNRFNYYTLGERLLFVVDSDSLGREWYVTDPTTNLATALLDINPGAGSGVYATTATQIGDQLFFAANDGESGNELWTTDGTPEGTYRVDDINPGAASSNPSDLLLNNGTIFFTANGPAGYELYRMAPDDLTPELIIDLHPSGDGHPYDFQADAENFYFLGRGGPAATFELYQIAYGLVPTEASPTHTPAKVYPNPAAGNLPVTVEAPAGEQLERVQLFGTAGQLLSEKTVQGPQTNLDLSALPTGTYWVRAWYTSGRFSINAVQRLK